LQKISLGFVILTSFLVTLFLMQPIAQMSVVEANFYPFGLPQISVRSPHSSPYIYVKSNVEISFDYHVANTQVDTFSYSLDGNANSTLNSSKKTYSTNTINYTIFETIENLANGNHKIIVYAHFSNNTVSSILSSKITVDTTFIPPIPFMISPLNQTTYNTKQVQLIYTINSKILWSYYSIDATDYIPDFRGFSGNITLPSLSEGSHKLKLIVTTESRSTTIYSDTVQTIYFNVDSKQVVPVLTPETCPTLSPKPIPTQPLSPTVTTNPTGNNSTVGSDLILNQIFPAAIFSAFGLILIVLMAVLYKRKRKVSDRYD
jgi:hypothetical protein